MTEEVVECMAERYREPPPPQASLDLAGKEWPELAGKTANGTAQHSRGALVPKHAHIMHKNR